MATILIVDDVAADREALIALLRDHGHRMLEAVDGREGLAAVRAECPDLVIAGLRMPVMDGHEFVRQLARDPATSRIPVLFYTAHAGERDARAGGAYGVLKKPAEVEEVLKMVGRALAGRPERYDAEAQLRLQAAALNAAANAIVITDRAGTIEWVNPAFCELTGYTAAEAMGRNPRDLLKSDQHDQQLYKTLWDTVLSGRVWRGEIVNRRKDGSFYTEDQTITPVRDPQDEIRHFIAVKQDVTERKRSIEALRAAEERTRFALQSAGVGIWDMDYAAGALRWSEIMEAQYGLQPGTFGGTFEAFVERVHPDDRASVLETMGRATRAGSDFSTQHRSLWPDGTVRWLSGAGRIIVDEGGEPVRGVGISQDVTERHTLEAQFLQAQKMEAVGQLAGGVAHDFNNLLTAILGYCELLLADIGQSDPRRADIAEIQKAGTRAAGLTRQLLAFSRKQIIEPTLVDLNVVIGDIRGMLQRLIGEDIKVAVRLRPQLAPVKADRGQVEQIVMNLAVNARDAMPGGGTLTIETANVELDDHYATMHSGVTPGGYVMLTVSDTGTGITPQVQARLFEPFFTTKEPGMGTGLGLATVYGIVKRTGGSVNVYSEVGKGTSFRVYIPRAGAAEMLEDAPAPVPLPRAGTQTVLVVEDEDGLRELAKRLLERQGYTVLAASDADQALQLFDQNPAIDVLLTDVVMPGTSGPELTRALAERRPGLKVIYMSGYTENAIVHHGVLKPGVAFIHKPFTSDTLSRKIREVLDR
jgi:PAS domain S-box-containing protein